MHIKNKIYMQLAVWISDFLIRFWRHESILPQRLLQSRDAWDTGSSHAVVAHSYNPNTEAEAGVSLWIWDQSSLQNKFQNSRAVLQRNPVFKNQQSKTKQQQKQTKNIKKRNRFKIWCKNVISFKAVGLSSCIHVPSTSQ